MIDRGVSERLFPADLEIIAKKGYFILGMGFKVICEPSELNPEPYGWNHFAVAVISQQDLEDKKLIAQAMPRPYEEAHRIAKSWNRDVAIYVKERRKAAQNDQELTNEQMWEEAQDE